MSAPAVKPAPTPQRVLWRLFLTLFLRGRSSRSLKLETAPRSVVRKLWTTLGIYALLGLFAAFFHGQPIFALSVYLHAMTFLLLGMFVSVSAGEVLFNQEEADILMHRPITRHALLRAKIGVLVQVSLWMAGALNVAGLVVGAITPAGGWLFVPVHVLSTALSALFCTGCVVLTYQLCLRWFGRERLDGLMTMTQVLVSVVVVLASQLMPQFIGRFGGVLGLASVPWWVRLLPPAWFAGIDDALSGSGSRSSWLLAAAGIGATAFVLWLAFAKLAGDYEAGLRALNEHSRAKPRRARRRWIDVAVKAPPLRWWLTDSASRASFLLTAAYLMRDRDTKLRVYPGIAPMLVMPFVFMFRGQHGGMGGSFGVAFAGVYLGLIPLMGLTLVRYSQHWQASDLFRVVPIQGPGRLCHGARRAVLCLLTAPMLVLFALIAFAMHRDVSQLALLLPGIIAIPVFAMVPCLHGNAVPFSQPIDAAQSSRRGTTMIGVTIVAVLWSALVGWGWTHGFFVSLLVIEAVVCAVAYAVMRVSVSRARWAPT